MSPPPAPLPPPRALGPQEAHEKANEIRIQTENTYNRDKLTVVQNERKKINDEFVRREKEQTVQRRVEKSRRVGDLRLVRMRAREQQLEDVMSTARENLKKVATTGKYEALMKSLMVQALVKINEKEVEFVVREGDKQLAQRLKDAALAEYKQKYQERFGRAPQVAVSVSSTAALRDECAGGVVATALDGRIRCDNTLATRLERAFEERLPQVRGLLYPSAMC